MNIILMLSALGIIGLAFYGLVKGMPWRVFLLVLGIVTLYYLLILNFGLADLPWSPRLQSRGGDGTLYGLLPLYLAMLVGMLAHSLFVWLDRPRRQRKKFDLGSFIGPVFVSPVVFIPLASAFGSISRSDFESRFLMLLLVAFENGFAWREFFYNRTQPAKE